MDPHCDKPAGDGYHANGQSDSEVWSEPVTEPGEARRPRLSFTDTYVETAWTYTRLLSTFKTESIPDESWYISRWGNSPWCQLFVKHVQQHDSWRLFQSLLSVRPRRLYITFSILVPVAATDVTMCSPSTRRCVLQKLVILCLSVRGFIAFSLGWSKGMWDAAGTSQSVLFIQA